MRAGDINGSEVTEAGDASEIRRLDILGFKLLAGTTSV